MNHSLITCVFLCAVCCQVVGSRAAEEGAGDERETPSADRAAPAELPTGGAKISISDLDDLDDFADLEDFAERGEWDQPDTYWRDPAEQAACDWGGCGVCVSCLPRTWVRMETLLWWNKRRSLPPLVTTSPTGTPREQAGVLGQGGTSILFGGEAVRDDMRVGGRLTVGHWLDDQQQLGLTGRFFAVDQAEARFDGQSQGDPILAQPFFNVARGEQDALLTAFPNVAAGNLQGRSINDVLGGDVFLRQQVGQGCDHRLDLVVGYQFSRIRDHLGMTSSRVGGPDSDFAVGAELDVRDRFTANNQFHAGQLGLLLEYDRGPWTLEVLGKLALGNMRQRVEIDGMTTVTAPGRDPVDTPGGLLAQPTNMGTFQRDRFAVMPELGLNLACQLTQRWSVSVGYSLLYWNHVVLVGDQVDPQVNLTQQDGPLVGPARPAFQFRETDFWLQGINLGTEFQF